RRADRGRRRARLDLRRPRIPGHRVRHDERGRWVRRHRPHARNVQPGAAMIPPTLVALLYLLSASLFIIGLKRLGSPATARKGNTLSGVGMLIAILVTLVDQAILSYGTIAAGLLVGSAVGLIMARTVKMTSMPQMV